jgi:transposase
MPRWAHNKMPAVVKQRYMELLREGYRGAAVARVVGVSTSCGRNWFLDAGGMLVAEAGPISSRFLDQDDRIAIADGLGAGRAVKDVAASIGKSFQAVYREVERNSKPDGSYQPWWAHNQALQRRKRPKPAKLQSVPELGEVVRTKLGCKWSPQQISRFLARSYPEQAGMRVCAETIYRGLFAGLLGTKAGRLDVIESLTPDAADDSLAVGVHPRRPRGTLDHIHILGLEDGVEGLAVLLVTVTQQEAQELHARAEVGGEIPRLLHGPVPRRVGGDATDVQASGAVLEERKCVHPSAECVSR